MDFRNGSDGGESGFDADSPPLFLLMDGTSLPEKKKTKKPMQRMPARTRVMGFERRNERDIVAEYWESRRTAAARSDIGVYEWRIRGGEWQLVGDRDGGSGSAQGGVRDVALTGGCKGVGGVHSHKSGSRASVRAERVGDV